MNSSRVSRGQLYAGLGVLTGAVFGIEGILSAPGSVFAATGILVGALYALLAIFWRG